MVRRPQPWLVMRFFAWLEGQQLKQQSGLELERGLGCGLQK